ncbi:zinc finger protein 233-like [Prionailurus viverrinus]|uniref:zinc finger protein 233-like n=1 Tax=Prionailurus viverrinus TaxID=61388 RepID=UPI001FF2016F|nr:zinc finger protein 233-like [Prionailurus viverrinus]
MALRPGSITPTFGQQTPPGSGRTSSCDGPSIRTNTTHSSSSYSAFDPPNIGHRNQNKMETFQKVGLRYLSHEDVIYWQIWEPFTSKLTRNQDFVINLQSKKSELPTQGDSSCRVWAGESQVIEDENCVIKLQGESSNTIKSQEIPIKTTWDFWKKIYLRESHNDQNRCQQIDVKNKPSKCDHCVMRRISQHYDDQEAHNSQKAYNHNSCGKEFLRK